MDWDKNSLLVEINYYSKKCETRREKGIKPKRKLLTDARLLPQPYWPLLTNSHQFIHRAWHSVVWNIPLSSSDQMSQLCSSWLLVNPLAVRACKTGKSLMFRVSYWAKTKTHQCVINIILILSPKHSTSLATRKKLYSIPAEKSTPVWCFSSFCQGVSQLSDMLCPCSQKVSKKVLPFLNAAAVAYCVCFVGPLCDFHSV